MIKKLVVFILFLGTFLILGWLVHGDGCPPKGIDLMEKILKEGNYSQFDSRGFGMHDSGDKTFKVFDWNFNIIGKINIPKGEGPAEYRSKVASACWIPNGHFYLSGSYDYRINEYNSRGEFIKLYKIDFIPFVLLERNSKLYAFNSGMELTNQKKPFLLVIDSATGETLKETSFQSVIEPYAPRIDEATRHFNILMDDKGLINILCGATGVLYKVDEDGKLISKTTLPFKDKKRVKIRGNYQNTKWYSLYRGATMMNGQIYTLFVEYNYKDIPKSKNHLIQIDKDGQVKKLKTVIGKYTLLGSNKGNVFLFERDEYCVLPVSVNKSKKQD